MATLAICAVTAGQDPAVFMITPRGACAAVAFSPDGTRLATASGDSAVHVWDAASGATLVTLIALSGGRFATLLPDGGYKLSDHIGDDVWWAIKLCRFAPGELDPYVPGLRRLSEDAPILGPPDTGAR